VAQATRQIAPKLERMIKLGGLLFIAGLLFWLWAIFDAITTDTRQVRTLPKILWIIVILVFFELGALAWFLLGRPRGGTATRGGPNGPRRNSFNRPPPKAGPVGPDDDPEFLRGL
jgi:hypothetical protein